MIFRNRCKNGSKLIQIGMMFLVIGLLWPNFITPKTQLGQDWSQGIRGLLFGLSIGINLWAARLSAGKRPCP